MVERIVPKTPALAERERRAINDLRGLFPDGNVAGLDNKDKALGKRLSALYRSLGYESRADMITALGFRQEPTMGRPVTVDPEALFDELQQRYEGEPKPAALGVLIHENPDLASTIKTVQNKCNELYGHTITIELIERGLLDRELPKRVNDTSDEEILQVIDALEKKYAKDAGRPRSLEELKQREPDYAEILDLLAGRRSNKLFGMPAGKYLKSRYIIGAGVIGADEEGIAKVLDTLQELYRGKPNDDKPKTVAALIKAHPEYANVLKAGQKAQLVTRDILTERGILGLSQAALKARAKVLKERCVRNAKVSELVRMYAGSGGAEVVLPDKCVDYLRPGVVGVDLKYRYELREVIVTALDADLAVGDVLKTFHSVSTGWYNRGQLELFKGESRVAHIVRPGEDDFLVSKSYVDPTPLKQYEGAEVVSLENVAGRQLARIRYRFLSLISRETLLYALYRMGALNDAELYANDDSWRARLELLPSDPVFVEQEINGVARREATISAKQQVVAQEPEVHAHSRDIAASEIQADSYAGSESGTEEPAYESASTAKGWTFSAHQRAQGRRFSVEVPDQWVLTPDEGGRPLARYEQGVEDESEYPQIICSAMAGDLDEETQVTLRENVIPETRIQLSREAIYSNDAANTLSRVVNDWVVEGKNCQVMVFEILMPSIFPGLTPDSYEYHVKPVAYDHEDFLRLADSWNHLEEGQLKELAFAIAPTIELDKPVVLERMAELDRYCEEPADTDAFCVLTGGLSNMLNLSNNNRMNANLWREIRRNNNDKGCLLVAGAMTRVQAESYNAGLDDEVAYYGRLVGALERQRELGVDGFERMWKLVGEFGDVRVADHVTMEGNVEAAEAINSLGIISIPAAYQALHERWEALDPSADGEAVAAIAADSIGGGCDSEADAEAVHGVGAEAKAGSTPNRQLRSVDFADRVLAERAAAKAEEEARRKEEAEAAARSAANRQQRSVDFADRVLAERAAAKADEPSPHEKRMAELRKKWADEAARREGRVTEQADQTPATPRRNETDGPARRKDPQEESERIARENSAREKKLNRLRQSWEEASGQESASSKAASNGPSGKKESTGPDRDEAKGTGEPVRKREKSKVKVLVVLAVLAIAAIAVMLALNASGEMQKQRTYDNGKSLMESGNYAQAAVAFSSLDGYEDSSSLAKEAMQKAREETFKGIKVGDTLELGSYEQDGDASNGKEPITWIVLDVEGDRALLLSYYGLDTHRYNETGIMDEKMDNAWGSSSLKEWMSSTFSDKAFSEGERVAYLADEPFCLSANEATKYLLSKNSATSVVDCAITAYAASQNPIMDYEPGETTAWWLRQDWSSSDDGAEYAPIMLTGGKILLPTDHHTLGKANRYESVRPAVYVLTK